MRRHCRPSRAWILTSTPSRGSSRSLPESVIALPARTDRGLMLADTIARTLVRRLLVVAGFGSPTNA